MDVAAPNPVRPSPAVVSLGFGLAIAAGSATILGSCFAFCIKRHNKWVLPSALGSAAGVMLYVSLCELLPEAIGEIEKSNQFGSQAGLLAVLFFFLGALVSVGLEVLVHKVDPDHDHDHSHAEIEERPAIQNEVQMTSTAPEDIKTAEFPIADEIATNNAVATGDEAMIKGELNSKRDNAKLLRAGLFTALAIGLHNIPEGLATFVATVANPTLGGSVAVAIALHNIPEGLSVSIPTYFATGSKWKSVIYTVLSACAEPFGALIGYAVVGSSINPFTFGAMFSFVSGMMVYVAARELLPQAHRFDKNDKYATKAFFGGIFIMAISIELFKQ
eukprot:TRINITY_DN1147_c0_g1_i1.p1 TRINITY_DN1147_c0_g1~~TRINITY_DN1147_c0_g1_i1.p1  ORF type:complete len:331 (-),score=103.81 TRINITY_DN1147_c0_g1_i1:134-1126(-)